MRLRHCTKLHAHQKRGSLMRCLNWPCRLPFMKMNTSWTSGAALLCA